MRSSAFILLQVINLSTKMDSSTSISYMTGKRLAVRCCFWLFWSFFHCTCAVSTMSQLTAKNITSYLNSAHPFSYKDAVISDAPHYFRQRLWRLCLYMRQSMEWVTQSDPWPKWPIELLTHDPCDPWPMGHPGRHPIPSQALHRFIDYPALYSGSKKLHG